MRTNRGNVHEFAAVRDGGELMIHLGDTPFKTMTTRDAEDFSKGGGVRYRPATPADRVVWQMKEAGLARLGLYAVRVAEVKAVAFKYLEGARLFAAAAEPERPVQLFNPEGGALAQSIVSALKLRVEETIIEKVCGCERCDPDGEAAERYRAARSGEGQKPRASKTARKGGRKAA